MGTIWVKEFTGGLDKRRLPETTPGGVLLEAVNGHISRGGEFEKRAAFVPVINDVSGTIGLGYNSKGLIAWGSTARPASLPSKIQYQQLVHPTKPAATLTAINSFDLYRDKPYVSATFSDGQTFHFYGAVTTPSTASTLVVDWIFGTAQFSFKVTGGQNVLGVKARVAFKVTGGTKSTSNANHITRIVIGTTQITRKAINHTGNNSTTAKLVADEINNYVSTPNYTAVANGNTVTIYAPAVGTAYNGKVMAITKAGNLTTDVNNVPMASGVNPVQSTIKLKCGIYDVMDTVGWVTSNAATAKAIASEINAFKSVREFRAEWDGGTGVMIIAVQPGVWANNIICAPTYTNGFTTDISGTNNKFAGGSDAAVNPNTDRPYQAGPFAMTVGSKEYAVSGPTLYFSKVGDPTLWQNPSVNTGAGFIDLSSYASGSERLTSLAMYQKNLAVFAMDSIQIWGIDPDPTKNVLSQVLYNAGTRSPHSVCQYGDNDIYFLDESGIRSLRARDSSNSAATSDIGVLVDPMVLDKLQKMDALDRAAVFGLIEPVDGRYWLMMGDLIFVFSYFAGAKVSAWTTYIPSVPGTDAYGQETDIPFVITDAITFRRRIYVRSEDNKIYCYAGEDPIPDYDRTKAFAQTPYLDGNAPGKEKDYQGIDVAVSGVWEVDARMDPTNPAALDKVCDINGTTFPNNRMPMTGRSTHISLQFSTRTAGKAKVGAALVHYSQVDGEDDGSR